MTETLHLEIDRAEGSLQRLIGLIERRGFHIDGMVMGGGGDDRAVTVRVRARDAHRQHEVLSRQIDRLHGVRRRPDMAAPEISGGVRWAS